MRCLWQYGHSRSYFRTNFRFCHFEMMCCVLLFSLRCCRCSLISRFKVKSHARSGSPVINSASNLSLIQQLPRSLRTAMCECVGCSGCIETRKRPGKCDCDLGRYQAEKRARRCHWCFPHVLVVDVSPASQPNQQTDAEMVRLINCNEDALPVTSRNKNEIVQMTTQRY